MAVQLEDTWQIATAFHSDESEIAFELTLTTSQVKLNQYDDKKALIIDVSSSKSQTMIPYDETFDYQLSYVCLNSTVFSSCSGPFPKLISLETYPLPVEEFMHLKSSSQVLRYTIKYEAKTIHVIPNKENQQYPVSRDIPTGSFQLENTGIFSQLNYYSLLYKYIPDYSDY